MPFSGGVPGTSSGATVRQMCPADVREVLSILEESPEASGWSESSLLESTSSRAAWVAEEGNGIVGFLLGSAVADEFEILNLAIAQSCRRRGIATRLVQVAMGWCRRIGAKRAYLEVRASNEAAIALYQKHGFAPCGRRARYYRDTLEDAIVLSAEVDDTSRTSFSNALGE